MPPPPVPPITAGRQTALYNIANASDESPLWRIFQIYNAFRLDRPDLPDLPNDIATAPAYSKILSQIFDCALKMKPEIVDAVNALAIAASQAKDANEAAAKRKRTASSPEPPEAEASKRQRSEVPPPDTRTLEGLEAVLRPVLDEAISTIDEFCSKEHPLPLWEPNEDCWKDYPEAFEYIKKLNIPAVPDSTDEMRIADLLLYNVGALETLDDELNTNFRVRIRNILKSNSHRALTDVSGAGKTRMLFEILAKNWGFYFTGATDTVKNPYGSSDVQVAVDSLAGASLPDGTRFTWKLRLNRDDKTISSYAEQDAAANWKIGEAVFSRLLLARILIFDIFRARCSSFSDNRGPLLWLLFQVAAGCHGDMFTTLFRSLETIGVGDIKQQIKDRMKRWPENLVPRVAVDEVQVLVTSDSACRQAFSSSAIQDKRGGPDYHLPRPVHKSFVQTIWRYFQENSSTTRLLFAGTRFCYEEARDALSGDAKGFEMHKFPVSSGLFDAEEIKTYMAHFLTRRVVDEIDADVFADVVFWLGGRHRFIAYMVQWILQLGPGSIKQILHSMLHCLVGHSLYEDVEPIAAIRLKPLLSQTLLSASQGPQNDQTAALIRAIEAVLELIIDGRYTYIEAADSRLVELGIGKFSDSVEEFQIRENLVLLCLMHWLSDETSPMSFTKALDAGLRRKTGAERGLSWEKAVAFILWRRLCRPGCTLNSLVAFHMPFREPTPVWGSYNAQLISHLDSNGKPVLQKSDFTTAIGATGSSRQSTIDWLTSNTRCPFFKPDDNMGADLCCRVLLTGPDGTSLVLLLCVQCKNGTSPLAGDALKETLWSVSPERFYAGVTGTSAAQDRATLLAELPPAWDDMVLSGPASSHDEEEYTLYSRNAPAGKKEMKIKYLTEYPRYAILRVVGSLPVKVPMHRVDYGRVGRYPLAQMKRAAFENADLEMNLRGFRRALEDNDKQAAKDLAKDINNEVPRRTTRSQT
ncbi:hypothetical protein EXIGLDRAFT_834298 [Exidia glandulosa HHB12029]|uniref:Uncharacterized protein n=1 Tax=Exidia glandulosa HHB12029 TaxID=1314781 RepID=A0A165JXE1_EXIGL|nr:hypothetical protein EXIGLDRAFT_834298 [Exidia glandulosa HHB12029]